MAKHDLPTLLVRMRQGGQLSCAEKLSLVLSLSAPSILAQLSTIVMQYIDAMMVGQLGAAASASIGLVSTSTWLCMGVCSSVCTGFAVQVAHRIGAADFEGARSVLRQALLVCLAVALCVAGGCAAMHRHLPVWLGGEEDVVGMASAYFLVWGLAVPVMQLLYLSNAMLRSSGNMRVPCVLGCAMCGLDVVFNLLLIPRHGVVGAALGSALAGGVAAALSAGYLLLRSPELSLAGRPGRLRLETPILRRAGRISLPMAAERVLFCGAQIVSTIIVSGIGTVAIAANAFGIVVESLCYMPGYGIGDAATTLIGQSYGARRADLIRSFARIAMLLGVGVMTAMGVVMYVFAPELMRLMTPDEAVRQASVSALRIEAFAEPMFAAAIVAYCIFVGLGDTLVPSVLNLLSIWLIRIPLAAILAGSMGVDGVWLAMCVELTVRGLVFTIRLIIKQKRIKE